MTTLEDLRRFERDCEIHKSEPKNLEPTNAVDSELSHYVTAVRRHVVESIRNLFAQGKHMSLNEEEAAEATKSVETLADVFYAVVTTLEALQNLGSSKTWISKTVPLISENLGCLVKSVSALNAINTLPKKTVSDITLSLQECAETLTDSCSVIQLVRRIGCLEDGVGNVGVSISVATTERFVVVMARSLKLTTLLSVVVTKIVFVVIMALS